MINKKGSQLRTFFYHSSLKLRTVFFKIQTDGVDAIAQSRLIARTVFKYMAQMRVAFLAQDFNARHSIAVVDAGFHRRVTGFVVKGRPAAAAMVFGF